jgi:hypothetical protein
LEGLRSSKQVKTELNRKVQLYLIDIK